MLKSLLLPILTLKIVASDQQTRISCYTCEALCEGDFYYNTCKNVDAESRTDKCKQDISCCEGSDMSEVFSETATTCTGKCISEFQMKGEILHSVTRGCGNGFQFRGKSIANIEYGSVYDEEEDCDSESGDCRHGCWCNEDFCNKADGVDDCYTKLTGVQTFMVVNAIVLSILFIAVEVLFRFKQRKINQAIDGLKSTYEMKRSDFKKAKFGLGKPAVVVSMSPEPTVFTDKNEIVPDFVEKVEQSNRSSVPEKFVLPVSEWSES